MFFKFLPFEAPSAFTWKDPDTKREFKESSKAALIRRITDYRSANNLEPIEHLSFVLETYWCHLPQNAGKCEPLQATPRGTLGYLKGGIALLRTVLYQSFASQKVADERSEQCAKCPYNSLSDDKPGYEAWSNSLAEVATDGRKSSKHEVLHECAVCGCPLKAKVFYNGTVESNREWTEKMKEVNCWQLGMMKNG